MFREEGMTLIYSTSLKLKKHMKISIVTPIQKRQENSNFHDYRAVNSIVLKPINEGPRPSFVELKRNTNSEKTRKQ